MTLRFDLSFVRTYLMSYGITSAIVVEMFGRRLVVGCEVWRESANCKNQVQMGLRAVGGEKAVCTGRILALHVMPRMTPLGFTCPFLEA